mmetsp:Transcript_89597/g.187156  ORF Transcript_89597/g.187156 Transcript_89597/m.187156 type:complete len:381 (+) Transcript_89597:53-1195(+)|eukprot:CAMPEP_0206455746 /NCGR_PEP_ID=MMETSP0324_2-20121206/21955_1 /ASSEMBLY_ACC=CAM_ASM_000836 /TAXON_ID=2866 /ORGANISM="Crypthecodinium cohnii, Strain Seligo" /LENGTH=380 /DNA_ID=CAMNT_0053926547 /DNA_START=53 /DNA_END=1195 /DNA_ORIENTATION=+
MFALLVLAAALFLGVGLAAWIWKTSQQGPEQALEKLGVRTTYQRPDPNSEAIDAYLELKETLRDQFCKETTDEDEDGREPWMAALPANEKNALKYKLLERAIGGVLALQRVDADSRGYWRLFTKGVITQHFWATVKEAEQDVSGELDAIKFEASSVEPNQDPQGLVTEAMQVVVRSGINAAHVTPTKEMLTEIMRKIPGPGNPPVQGMPSGMPPGMVPPGMMSPGARPPNMPPGMQGMPPGMVPPGMMPPGMMPPGMMPPGAMPPGMRPGGPPPGHPANRGPPPNQAQAGGEDKSYAWKQDTDELEVSVHLPSEAVKSKLQVKISPKQLKVVYAGDVLVDGALAGGCIPDGSTWTISKGACVISLEKADPRPWPSVFVKS